MDDESVTTRVDLHEVMAGADMDGSVSADAMRWSPSLARSAGVGGVGGRTWADGRSGVDCSTGVGAALRPYLRRLAVRAVAPFAEVAVDVRDELRGLRRPRRRNVLARS
jgi:hypothetical protein